tara:strand:+ start:401 stop:982 length:582 start_codon:yes stop_codon:yes gene_type:complete
MNIALPILLLVFGGLSFWVLTESTVKWYIKTACISVFCLFTVIFWTTIHTFLGWPANEEDAPEKVLIHWVIIKEPNEFKEFEGAIYILLESMENPNENKIFKFFGYKKDRIEPRLYQLKYSRNLHEQLQKIKGKLQKGQPVTGKLSKDKDKNGKGKSGKKNTSDKKGDGSESQEQTWEFHELLPSEIHRKPID